MRRAALTYSIKVTLVFQKRYLLDHLRLQIVDKPTGTVAVRGTIADSTWPALTLQLPSLSIASTQAILDKVLTTTEGAPEGLTVTGSSGANGRARLVSECGPCRGAAAAGVRGWLYLRLSPQRAGP